MQDLRKRLPSEPAPLVLSGRVFTAGILAYDRPDLSVPDRVNAGDIKLLAVPTERAGVKRKGELKPYTGFFTACVFDGKLWRKFNLRAGAAFKARYVSNGDRQSRLASALPILRQLVGATSVWGDKAYEVRVQPAALAQKKPSRPQAASTSGKKLVQGTLFE